MAAFLIGGLDVRAVRLLEVGSALIDPASNKIVSWSMSLASMRTVDPFGGWLIAPMDVGTQFDLRSSVEVDFLALAIAKAETAADDDFLTGIMSFFLETHTHFQAQEFRQSLVMAWLVIESWLDKTLDDYLAGKNVSKNRKERLTAEKKLEILERSGSIDRSQSLKLTEVRKRRNNVVHKGHNPSSAEAKKALELAREFCSAEYRIRTNGETP